MAQTTTAINACNAVIEIDDDGGTPVNISGSSNNANLSINKALGEGFTFDGDWAFRLECKKNGSLDIEAIYTTASNEARDLLETWFENGGNRTVIIYPNGKTNGERMYSGEFKLGDFDPLQLSASEAAPMKIAAKLQPDGAIAFATYTT